MTLSPPADAAIAVASALVFFFAYLVRGIAEFGSGLIAVPLLSLMFPVTTVVPLVVLLDYIGSASQGVKNVDQIAWRDQLALVPFMLEGWAPASSCCGRSPPRCWPAPSGRS